jgi:hypothetical protein
MNESEKTRKIRSAEFIEKYFQGNIIDIGAGSDPVTRTLKFLILRMVTRM